MRISRDSNKAAAISPPGDSGYVELISCGNEGTDGSADIALLPNKDPWFFSLSSVLLIPELTCKKPCTS